MVSRWHRHTQRHSAFLPKNRLKLLWNTVPLADNQNSKSLMLKAEKVRCRAFGTLCIIAVLQVDTF